MNRITAAAILLVAAILTEFGLHMTQPLGEDFYIITDIAVVLFGLIAFLAAVYAYRIYGIRSNQGKAILLLASGILFWFLGEFTWMYIEVILSEEVPIVSVADVFWLTGYPLFFAGAFLAWRTFSAPITKEKKMLIAVTAIAVFSVVVVGVIIPVLSDTEMSALEFAVTAGYVISDLILLIMFMILIISFFGGKFAKPWMFISAGSILSVVADMVYMTGIYESGSIVDILWELEYMLIAFGLFYYRESVKSALVQTKAKKG
jgi:hypothetical protein